MCMLVPAHLPVCARWLGCIHNIMACLCQYNQRVLIYFQEWTPAQLAELGITDEMSKVRQPAPTSVTELMPKMADYVALHESAIPFLRLAVERVREATGGSPPTGKQPLRLVQAWRGGDDNGFQPPRFDPNDRRTRWESACGQYASVFVIVQSEKATILCD